MTQVRTVMSLARDAAVDRDLEEVRNGEARDRDHDHGDDAEDGAPPVGIGEASEAGELELAREVQERAPALQLLETGAAAVRPAAVTGGGRHQAAPSEVAGVASPPASPCRSVLSGSVKAAALALGVAEHVRVEAAGGHQLVVPAALLYPAVVEDDDLLGQRDRAGAVGDDEGGAAAHDLLQRGPDAELGLDVDAAGGVVEDEDARVHHERPRDRDALALAAAEREAALTDDGLVALGERLDEVVGLRGLRTPPGVVGSLASGLPKRMLLGDGQC